MTTKAMAVTKTEARIAPEIAAKLPGRVIASNPLVAAVVCMTDEHVQGLDDEIQVTEKYLAGLKAMKAAVSPPPLPPPLPEPLPPEPMPEPQPEPPATIPMRSKRQSPVFAAVAPEPGKTVTPEPGKTVTVSAVMRAIVQADPNVGYSVVAQKVREAGFDNSEESIRSLLYNVRSKVKQAGKKVTEPPSTVKEAAAATRYDSNGSRKMPQDVGDELKLRKEVAEFIFKKGLVSTGDIIRVCGISHDVINSFMNHPWFESHMQNWRLTATGKREGLDY